MSREMTNKEAIWNLNLIYSIVSPDIQRSLDLAIKALEERQQGEWKKYKPLEPDYNVQCAVANLRKAYWSNEPEEVAKYFTEAEDTITCAICHYGYTVCKQPQGEWIRVDDEKVKCSICEVIHLMYSYPGTTANYCPNCGAKMKGGAE